MSVKIDDLTKAVMKELEFYSNRLTEDIKTGCKEVATGCRDKIRQNSPVKTGAYRKGWSKSGGVRKIPGYPHEDL